MKQATRALATLVCAVSVGCATPQQSPVPPIASEATVVLRHTRDTNLLVEIAFTAEYEQQYDVALQFESATYPQLIEQLNNQTIRYFIAHHPPTTTASEISAIPLVQDGLAMIRHPDNPVTTLTREQLQRIYRGFIMNWQELGGIDEAIIVYTRPNESALHLAFNRLVMGNQAITPNAQILTSSEQMLTRIAETPYSIGYIPISSLNNEVMTIAIDDITPTVAHIADNSYPLRITVYGISRQPLESTYQDLTVWIQNLSLDDLEGRFAPLAR